MINKNFIILILVFCVSIYLINKYTNTKILNWILHSEISYTNKKILNLILYSETSLEYINMYKILSKYLKKMKIQYYFYAYDPHIDKEYIINDDIIYIKGYESLVPGCLEKTLKVFDICKDLEFEYVIRTNISQIVNFKLLNNILSTKNIEYGGGTILNLQWIDKPNGIIDDKYWNTHYIRGNAIIFSREIFDLILDGKDEILSYNIIDDVAFGVFLKYNKANITPIYENINSLYDKTAIFYRNKNNNRNIDVENMRSITNDIIHESFST
jgi:hypothetical protein